MSSTQSRREGLKTAAMAQVMEQLDHENRMTQQMDKFQFRKATGEPLREGEDVGVHVGDIYNPEPQSAPQPTSNGLTKMLIGGALMATGAGAGIGLPMLIDGGKDVIIDKAPEIRYMLDLSGGDEVDRVE